MLDGFIRFKSPNTDIDLKPHFLAAIICSLISLHSPPKLATSKGFYNKRLHLKGHLIPRMIMMIYQLFFPGLKHHWVSSVMNRNSVMKFFSQMEYNFQLHNRNFNQKKNLSCKNYQTSNVARAVIVDLSQPIIYRQQYFYLQNITRLRQWPCWQEWEVEVPYSVARK